MQILNSYLLTDLSILWFLYANLWQLTNVPITSIDIEFLFFTEVRLCQ